MTGYSVRAAKMREGNKNQNSQGCSMNVLVVTGIFPPDIGGPASYVPSISSELVKRGHKITLVTLSDTIDHDDHAYPLPGAAHSKESFQTSPILSHGHAHSPGRATCASRLCQRSLSEAVIANLFLRKPSWRKLSVIGRGSGRRTRVGSRTPSTISKAAARLESKIFENAKKFLCASSRCGDCSKQILGACCGELGSSPRRNLTSFTMLSNCLHEHFPSYR